MSRDHLNINTYKRGGRMCNICRFSFISFDNL